MITLTKQEVHELLAYVNSLEEFVDTPQLKRNITKIRRPDKNLFRRLREEDTG